MLYPKEGPRGDISTEDRGLYGIFLTFANRSNWLFFPFSFSFPLSFFPQNPEDNGLGVVVNGGMAGLLWWSLGGWGRDLLEIPWKKGEKKISKLKKIQIK